MRPAWMKHPAPAPSKLAQRRSSEHRLNSRPCPEEGVWQAGVSPRPHWSGYADRQKSERQAGLLTWTRNTGVLVGIGATHPREARWWWSHQCWQQVRVPTEMPETQTRSLPNKIHRVEKNLTTAVSLQFPWCHSSAAAPAGHLPSMHQAQKASVIVPELAQVANGLGRGHCPLVCPQKIAFCLLGEDGRGQSPMC